MKTMPTLALVASLLLAPHLTAEPACCHAEIAADEFSAKSLYQIDVGFTTDAGATFTLGELRGQPVVLTMFFASCGYACPLLVSDMTQIREKLPANIRDQAVFVLVSFDVERDTPAALHTYRTERGLDDQWILLHGDDDAVRELAALLGVKYKLENNGMFSHSNLITVLNLEGEIEHQREGLKGGLDETAQALSAVAVTKK
jgi:protein SCO1